MRSNFSLIRFSRFVFLNPMFSLKFRKGFFPRFPTHKRVLYCLMHLKTSYDKFGRGGAPIGIGKRP